MDETESVLRRHLGAFADRDLDAMVDTYAPDAVMMNEHQTFRGHAEIRAEFSRLFDVFDGTDLSENGRIATKTVGEYAYITWSAETEQKIYEFVTATFVISEGVIQFQTMTTAVREKTATHG